MMFCTSARAVGVQYYRTLMLVVLGLSVLAVLTQTSPMFCNPSRDMLSLCAVTAFGGSVAWTLGRVKAGRLVTVTLFLEAFAAMIVPWLLFEPVTGPGPVAWLGGGTAVASAALLGSMMAAMLLGHSYLIAPAMSIDPLKRLIKIIAFSLAGRAAMTGGGLAMLAAETDRRGSAPGHDAFWWGLVATRWMIGLVAPAVITWMVWQTAKIRSTQSATGILYVGVVFTFLGELCDEIVMAPLWTAR
jgi:hypothetical protein